MAYERRTDGADAGDLLPSTVGEIEAIAKQISVAEGLDGEIQAELRGHIEDKVRGYVKGEVKVSEGDALILAKSHFGEAGVLKALFQNVHAPAYWTSLARRMAAAFVVYQMVSACLAVASAIWKQESMYPTVELAYKYDEGFSRVPQLFFGMFSAAFGVALFWWPLSVWRKQFSRGERLWFQKWSPFMLALLVITSIVVRVGVMGKIIQLDDAARSSSEALMMFNAAGVLFGNRIVGWIELVATMLLWLWWCDSAPRTSRTVLYGAVFWMLGQQFVYCCIIASEFEILRHRDMFEFLHDLLRTFANPRWIILNIGQSAPVVIGALILYLVIKRSQRHLIAE